MATKTDKDVVLSDIDVIHVLLGLDSLQSVWKRRVNSESDATVKKHYQDGVLRLQDLSGKIRGGAL